jgi:hypothetical protein
VTVETQFNQAMRIKDPLVRARRLHAVVFPAVIELHRSVLDARAKAVAEANLTLSYGTIAEALGCSKPLVQQLAQAGRGRPIIPKPRRRRHDPDRPGTG